MTSKERDTRTEVAVRPSIVACGWKPHELSGTRNLGGLLDLADRSQPDPDVVRTATPKPCSWGEC